ncbi:Uncharacterised protein g7153 [Pycnogonum litorale]
MTFIDGSIRSSLLHKDVMIKDELPPRPTVVKWDIMSSQPYFDNDTKGEVRVQLGKSARLHCTVNQLADRTVSWVRQSDYHILTVGTYTYTRDIRFKSHYHPESERWTLEIKLTRKNDAGIYECQVNSEPKISKEIHVDVLAAKAKIVGSSELYIRRGSNVRLTCQIVDIDSDSSLYVIWYHNHNIINFDSPEISVENKRGKTTTSTLRITRASEKNSGNYSCKASYADPASIMLHVVHDENPAAMHYGCQVSIKSSFHTTILACLLVFVSKTAFKQR